MNLLTELAVDGLERIVDAATIGDGGQLSLDRSTCFGREGAIVDRRHFAEPIGEVLPDWLATKEVVARFVSVTVARCQQRANGALIDEDALIEVDITGPDGLEEVDGFVRVLGRGQNVPA
ncbi:hypothetical protein PSQ19_13585 [Devosia algicola]|uniref:Uncharacterized protein n=1 Tax=Devosia algicola TaxID=3026418 RepID=A0ABY7YKD0_9HYPH|nr:hypothetical protein [Devosia algicola]WDR01763.1 hypothetical protein PSQ19_13585 [Devosia algicola]